MPDDAPTIAGDALAELQRLALLGRLLAGALHEVSTPASSILSNADVSLRAIESLAGTPLPDRAARTIETLRGLAGVDKLAAERIAAVVRGVKTLARCAPDAPCPTDLNALLSDALKLVAHEFRGRITVETEFGELPKVSAYPTLLGQVFLNLLVNAGHAIDGEGKVVVRTRTGGDAIVASVSDTGRGIDPAHRDRIFSAGFTTKPAGIGAGLGLAISKEIVEKHGGSLDFESEPGKGATFFVRLPRM